MAVTEVEDENQECKGQNIQQLEPAKNRDDFIVLAQCQSHNKDQSEAQGIDSIELEKGEESYKECRSEGADESLNFELKLNNVGTCEKVVTKNCLEISKEVSIKQKTTVPNIENINDLYKEDNVGAY